MVESSAVNDKTDPVLERHEQMAAWCSGGVAENWVLTRNVQAKLDKLLILSTALKKTEQ